MRKLIVLVFSCFLFCAVAFAYKDFSLTPTSIVPAAGGKVEVGTDDNGNSKVKIKVQHLAKPEKLTPPRNTYIVWFQENGGNPQPQGRLKVDDDLKAEFETTTAWKNFQLLITAENDPTATMPSGPEVLRTTINR